MIQEAVRTVKLKVDGQQAVSIQLGEAPFGIGRDRSNGLVLQDNKVSRQHAELLLRDGTVFVRDRGSSNGTAVNGERLGRGSERALSKGDVIEIGPYRLELGLPLDKNSKPASSAASLSNGRPDSDEKAPSQPWRVSAVIRSFRGLLLAVFALLIIAVVVVWLLSPPFVSVLILGTDARPTELALGDRGRTDTLVTYVADREAGRNLMISVPRDLWVQTSATTAAKINTVYRSNGSEGTRRAVSSALGLPIDRYMVIGLQGVRDVVDAVGGIDVVVESAIRDDQYPTDDFGVTVFEISAGPHHLDGETALRFARTRHGDDDLARIGRQQRVLTGIRNALSNPLNWWRLPGVLLAVQRTTQTDLGPRELATLATAYVMSPGAPERFAPDWNMVQAFTTPQGEAALRLQPSFRDALAALLVGPRGASVEVLNASGRSGVAQRGADALTARGVRVSRVGTADRVQAESVIQVRSRYRLAGQAVTSILGLGSTAVQVTSDLPADLDVRVLLGLGYAAS
jgi:LCP family protein required for cell wall assembly